VTKTLYEYKLAVKQYYCSARLFLYGFPIEAFRPRSGYLFGLFHQHHGDIILDFIKQFALITNDTVFFFIKTNLSPALGTD
jgi:hypothetical protein